MMISDNYSNGNFHLQQHTTAFTDPDSFSSLTYSLPISRKRSRDMFPNNFSNPIIQSSTFTFLGQDISSQIQQQHFEIDQFLTHHTEKLRAQIEEKRRRNSTTIIAALEEGITQRLREKEEEIVKIAKLNWALEEKVKSLCIENQIWRELAITNEATANALRGNLEQVLEQVVVNGDFRREDDDIAADDAQSCCESNNEDVCTLAEQDSRKSSMMRLCRSCGKGESCVLLLPCRHLCLCTVCASSVDICPICKSTKNISIHVHMS